MSRFAHGEAELLYLDLISKDMSKVDAQREAGITRSAAEALERRIQRVLHDPR